MVQKLVAAGLTAVVAIALVAHAPRTAKKAIKDIGRLEAKYRAALALTEEDK